MVSLFAEEKAPDPRLFELRVYHAMPGKLDSLLTRFRDHTTKLFEKHGMTNIGYWVPVDNKDNILVYLLAYPDRAAHDASWKAFLGDEEWKKVLSASEADEKKGNGAPEGEASAADRPGAGSCTMVSTSVFHSPQSGHLPCHLGCALPHTWQT